jgi:hypothetical protein
MKALAISWVEPTTNVDGTPISLGEITGYTIGARSGGVAGTYPFTYNVTGASTQSASVLPSAFTPPLTPGTYFASIQAVGPSDSAWSPEVQFSVLETPNAPTGFTVA